MENSGDVPSSPPRAVSGPEVRDFVKLMVPIVSEPSLAVDAQFLFLFYGGFRGNGIGSPLRSQFRKIYVASRRSHGRSSISQNRIFREDVVSEDPLQ